MYIKKVLDQYKDKRIKLFVDMDGVIVDFDIGNKIPFNKKRPLVDSIKKLEEVSKLPNVELYILSATGKEIGVEQKHEWLDQYAPFFKKENRIIIYKKPGTKIPVAELKANKIRGIKRDNSVLMVIDDDPKNLKAIMELNEDVILLKDSVLVDDTSEKLRKKNNKLFIALCNAYPEHSWKIKLNDEEFILELNTEQGALKQVLKMKYWDECKGTEAYTEKNPSKVKKEEH